MHVCILSALRDNKMAGLSSAFNSFHSNYKTTIVQQFPNSLRTCGDVCTMNQITINTCPHGPWFPCAAALSVGGSLAVSVRMAPQVVYDSIGNKARAAVTAHRNHRHRLVLSKRPNGPRNPNPRPSTYSRPARGGNAGRTGACNHRRWGM